jgi:hypothetical protein
MGRRPKNITKVKTNLTLDPDIKADAIKLADSENKSLSELVDELLVKFITADKPSDMFKDLDEKARRVEGSQVEVLPRPKPTQGRGITP